MPPRTSRNGTDVDPRRPRNQGEGAEVEHAKVEHAPARAPFWRTKTLDDMSPEEWESLCDRCGRCCLVKLEDEDTGEILKTDIACKLFDAGSCSCASYASRHRKVGDCIQLTPESVRSLRWLPSTCAYRLVAEGKPLAAWHPLVSGSPESVHRAGISVKGRVGGSEKTVRLRDYVDHVVTWDD